MACRIVMYNNNKKRLATKWFSVLHTALVQFLAGKKSIKRKFADFCLGCSQIFNDLFPKL